MTTTWNSGKIPESFHEEYPQRTMRPLETPTIDLDLLLGIGGITRAAIQQALKHGTQGALKKALTIDMWHAARRMEIRGVTEDMIEVALRKGLKFWDPKNQSYVYVLKGGMASGKDLLVAIDPVSGMVKTTIRGNNLISPRFVPVR